LGSPAKRAGNYNYEPRSCQYEFQWETEFACPACAEDDYVEVVGLCVGGTQNLTLVNVNPCTGGFIPGAVKTRSCVAPSRADRPPAGHTFLIAETRINGITAAQQSGFASTVAVALEEVQVFANQVDIIAVVGDIVTFRIDHASASADKVAFAIKEKFTDAEFVLPLFGSNQSTARDKLTGLVYQH
jgi:hypothetical protein